MVSPLLAEVLAASREAWPDVSITDEDFVAYVAERAGVPDTTLDEALRTLCITDLWLACAIARRDAAALRAFDAQLAHVGEAIAHLDGGSALVADVTAAVRERVLGTGGDGKITDFRGRGDLRGWLRVIAVREAVQIMRARKREAPLPEGLPDAVKLDESTQLSPDEQRVYRDAFSVALAQLTPRERNLIRQQYIYGATIDELGALYGVHRATAARWIAQIRETLLRRTRRHVADAMRLTGTELDSAMGRIAGHLDYSLRHTLSRE
ncbi:MAG: sigma-70 family RNA polymerase sigma factor [Kofleriaceae bacterium]